MRRRRTRRSVTRLARRKDIEGLVGVLDGRDLVKDRDGVLVDVGVPTRVQALAALGELEDERAADAVARALADPDDRVRLAAVHAFEKWSGDGGRAAQLAEALVRWDVDAQAPEHSAALAQLHRSEPPPGLVLFVDALLAAEPGRRVTAADREAIGVLAAGDAPSLARLCERLAGRLAEDPRAGQVLVAIGEPAAEALVSALTGPGTLAAVEALGELRSPQAVEPLTALMSHDDPGLRAAVAQALGTIRDPQAAEALVRASLDADPAVRDAAQAALERLGTAGVLAGLAAFVRPLIGRIEQLEAAQREPRLITAPEPAPAPAPPDRAGDFARRPALEGLRRALRR